jgi:hypothetical protein
MPREKGPGKETDPGAWFLLAAPVAPAAAWSAAARSTTSAPRPAAAGPTLGLGARLVDDEVPVAEEPAVEHLDRLGGFLFGRHFDETEAARTAGELIGHDPHRLDGAGLLEELAEILFRSLEGKVADEQLCGHHVPPAAIRTEGALSPAHRRRMGIAPRKTRPQSRTDELKPVLRGQTILMCLSGVKKKFA